MNPYQEFLSCQQDFSYFAENYLKINHPVRGTIPLKLYPFQKKLLDVYEKNKFVLALKFRQGGFTTISLLHAFWNCMFKSGITYGVSCRTEQESIHLSKVVDRAVANLPDWFSPKFSKNTQTEKSFSVTGSKMIFGSMESISGQTYRGKPPYLNLTHLFIDEAAFIPNMKEKWENFWLFNREVNIYGISTTNGIGNWFEETWTNAEKGRNAFVTHHPDYREHYQDEAELDNLRQRLGEKVFRQEVLGEFVRQEVLGEFVIEEPEFGKVIYLNNEELINMGIKVLNSTKISFEEKAAIHEIILRLARV
jgi:hypothetical protein